MFEEEEDLRLDEDGAGADVDRVEVYVRAAAVEVLGSKTPLRVTVAKVEEEALTSMFVAMDITAQRSK